MTQKQIKGLDLSELTDLCCSQNFPEFRAKQIYHWMYRHNILEISQMTNIPLNIQNHIKENYILKSLKT